MTRQDDPKVRQAIDAIETHTVKVATYIDVQQEPPKIEPFMVKWEDAWPLLQAVWHSPVKEDPRAGKIVNFISAATGDVQGTTPSMIAGFQIIPPATRGMAHKHTMAAIQFVFKGRGYSIINGERYNWTAGDIVVFPAGAMHEHGNLDPEEPAILFHVLDSPLVKGLRIKKIEELLEGHQQVTSEGADSIGRAAPFGAPSETSPPPLRDGRVGRRQRRRSERNTSGAAVRRRVARG